MNPTKISLLSLSSDLNRISLSIARNSPATAERFSQEANRWLKEIDPKAVKPYIRRVLKRIARAVVQENSMEKAEECLTWSVILRNYAITAL